MGEATIIHYLIFVGSWVAYAERLAAVFVQRMRETMKHFLVLLLIAVLGYGLWTWFTPRQQALGKTRLQQHGPRLLLLAAMLLAALVAAFFFPALKLL